MRRVAAWSLALVVLALLEPDGAELARKRWQVSSSLSVSWPHHRLFYTAVGLTALLVVPQLVSGAMGLVWRFRFFGRPAMLPGGVVMLPYAAALLAFVVFAAQTRTACQMMSEAIAEPPGLSIRRTIALIELSALSLRSCSRIVSDPMTSVPSALLWPLGVPVTLRPDFRTRAVALLLRAFTA